MKNPASLFVLLVLITACNSTRQGTGSRTSPSKQPEFLDGITLRADKQSSETPGSPTAHEPGVRISDLVDRSPEQYSTQQFKYAILMDVPVEDVADERLIRFLESWYGAPYRIGGSSREGIDCSALVQSFLLSLYNMPAPRTSREQFDASVAVNRDDLRQGDLVFFHTQGKRLISHVGVYLRNGRFVHASTTGGVMISALSEPYYATRFAGGRRLEKMTKSISDAGK